MSMILASASVLTVAAPPVILIQPQASAVSVISQESVTQEASQDPDPVPNSSEASNAQFPETTQSTDTGETPAEAATEPSTTSPSSDSGATVEGPDIIVIAAQADGPLKDPLENINIATFDVTQDIDNALVGPVANFYEENLPSPVREVLRNFFRNLLEPINAFNYLLQLNPGKSAETLGRFAINSTIGIGGLVDVAEERPFNLPHRRNGFSNTLGYYGVGPGPFLVLPLIGPTTVRDLVGVGLDQAILPFAVGRPFNTPAYSVSAFTVDSLSRRIENDERIDAVNESYDPYYVLRESYLCKREAEIAALRNQPAPRDCSIDAF